MAKIVFVPAEIRQRIERDVRKYVAMAEAHFGRKYEIPTVTYDLCGTTAGIARGTRLIKLNSVLLMENLEDMIANTVPHEVAHCIDTANGDNQLTEDQRAAWIANRMAGRRVKRPKRSVHGPSWRHIMRVFGISDAEITRCHNYDVTNAKVRNVTRKRYDWQCSGCRRTISVGPKVNARLVLGAHYWGKCCGPTTRLIRPESIAKTAFGFEAWKRPAAPPPPAPAFNALQPRAPQLGNVAIAKSIWTQYGGGLTRGEFIARAVAQGLKATTASTYYAGLKAGRL